MTERVRELVKATVAARAKVIDLAGHLSPAQLDTATANEGWTIKDTLAHLSSIEARVRAMLTAAINGAPWSADRADLDAFNLECVKARRSWTAAEIIDELRQTGAETDAVLAGLSGVDLDREWSHPIFGPMTIERTAGIIARHLHAHSLQLEAALDQ
ncbi:MAG: DinB family protein [Chloroflexota bacterium]